jgi:hypothetical protein
MAHELANALQQAPRVGNLGIHVAQC